MPLRFLSAAVAVAITAAVLAACGGDDAGSPGGAKLVGPQWVLDNAALGVDGADSVTSTIRFEAERVSGSDGCNQFSGPYERDGSKLKLGPLAATQMACAGPAQQVAQHVTTALGSVASYTVSETTLRLRDSGGDDVLIYRASTPGVEGTWDVTNVLYDDAIRGVITGTKLGAVFGGDGRVSGSAGCNTFRGPYTSEGERLRIGPVGSTRKACREPEGIAEQETGYIAALESVVRFEQAGNRLTLLNAKGQMAVILER